MLSMLNLSSGMIFKGVHNMTVKKIIELRHLKEWTKVDTAKMLEIHVKRYDRIERGVNRPNNIERQRMTALLEKYDNRRTPEYRQLKSEVVKNLLHRMDRKVENWKDLDEDDEDLNALREVFGIPR